MRARMFIVGGVLFCGGGGSAYAQPINLLDQTQTSSTVQTTALPAPTASTFLPMMPVIASASYATAIPPLEAAEAALTDHRYGFASQDLETAETRLLNDGALPNVSTITAGGQALAQVQLARDAVRHRDRPTELTAINMAIAALQEPVQPMIPPVAMLAPPASRLSLAPPAPLPPPVPMMTQALLPGHWQEGSWQYHWVPPETTLRPVETRPVVQGTFVWTNGMGWVWVPSHYGNE